MNDYYQFRNETGTPIDYYQLVNDNNELCKEIERLNKKIEQYENPEDMTLMFMWCDEKAKDEIKRLNNIINEIYTFLSQYTITHTWQKVVIEDTIKYIEELKGSDKE